MLEEVGEVAVPEEDGEVAVPEEACEVAVPEEAGEVVEGCTVLAFDAEVAVAEEPTMRDVESVRDGF